jgi:hypothetical protein
VRLRVELTSNDSSCIKSIGGVVSLMLTSMVNSLRTSSSIRPEGNSTGLSPMWSPPQILSTSERLSPKSLNRILPMMTNPNKSSPDMTDGIYHTIASRLFLISPTNYIHYIHVPLIFTSTFLLVKWLFGAMFINSIQYNQTKLTTT